MRVGERYGKTDIMSNFVSAAFFMRSMANKKKGATAFSAAVYGKRDSIDKSALQMPVISELIRFSISLLRQTRRALAWHIEGVI